MKEQESIASTLKEMRDLITSPEANSENTQEILELTEDDIYDELDEDHQDPDNILKESEEKTLHVNPFLTRIENNNHNNRSKLEEGTQESDSILGASEEMLVKSAAHIRNLIKKMESPSNKKTSSDKPLEKVIFDSLKPYLDEWLEQKIIELVKKELESAAHSKDSKI